MVTGDQAAAGVRASGCAPWDTPMSITSSMLRRCGWYRNAGINSNRHYGAGKLEGTNYLTHDSDDAHGHMC